MRPRAAAVVVVAALVATTAAAAPARADEVTALIAEGDALAGAGEPAAALARYEKALARDPDRLAAYDRATPLWIAAQAWDVATTWLEKATLRQPRYAAGWYALGYVYRRTGRAGAAVGAYQEYVVLRPDDAAGVLGLAIAHELAGEADDAARAYRRYLARERDPARAAYRAQAREALARVVPPPPTARAAALAIVTGEATWAAWAVLAGADR